MFLKRAFQELHPGESLADNWHIKAMARHLESIWGGPPHQGIITMPPRSLKSFTVSVAWVAFLLGQNPTIKIMVISYSEKLAEELSGMTRKLMESEFYKRTFPGTVLDQRSKLLLKTTQGGMRFASSIEGGITGFGCELMIIDDPHNASTINSDVQRKTVFDIFNQTLPGRFNNQSIAKTLIVMQRLHPNDLAGELIALGGWSELRLQAYATEPAQIDIGEAQPLLIRPGNLLHAQRLSRAKLDQLAVRMGSRNFSAQYLQTPKPLGTDLFRKELIRTYANPLDRTGMSIIHSWDTAYTTNSTSDYSVCTVIGVRDGLCYILDVFRARLEFPKLVTAVCTFCNQRPNWVLIEEAGSGTILLQNLKAKGMHAIGIKPKGDKVSRFIDISPMLESGGVLFPPAAPWLDELIQELVSFPSAHDDQVDSLTQGLAWARDNTVSSFEVYWMDKD